MAERVEVLGCIIDNLSMSESLDKVEAFIASGRPHVHGSVNADKLVLMERNPELKAHIAHCDLVNADGMPVVWASRLLGSPLKERVTGVDLFEALVERAARRGWRIFLLGAREDVVRAVKQRYEDEFPGIRIVGYRNGYWTPAEEEGVVEQIKATRPDMLFLGMSSPKKERFLMTHQPYLAVPYAMGVGGTFDVVCGQVRRAPLWMQKLGLEWFFRFLQEPRRMFRRYFVDDMAFFSLLAREMLRGRQREA